MLKNISDYSGVKCTFSEKGPKISGHQKGPNNNGFCGTSSVLVFDASGRPLVFALVHRINTQFCLKP
jgi:hypothetical protein